MSRRIAIAVLFALALFVAIGMFALSSVGDSGGRLSAHHGRAVSDTPPSHLRYLHWREQVTRHEDYLRWRASQTLVPSRVMANAQRVADCEEGGNWHVHGAKYSGGLGFLHATWYEFKAPSSPSDMGNASPEQQAWALWQFAKHFGYWPDVNGCHAY